MSELVRDPVYRNFLITKPKMPKHLKSKDSNLSPPWVVYVQREADGPWGKKEFWKYKDALQFFSRAVMKVKVHDAALNNKRIGYDPPKKIVRIKGKYHTGNDGVRRQQTKQINWTMPIGPDDPEHHWCRYCRRPVVFKFLRSHKRLGRVDESAPRCCICGASARIALMADDRMFRVH